MPTFQLPASLDFVSDPDRHWYAMRVFRGKVFSLRKEIDKAGYRTYMAMKTVDKVVDGRLTYETVQIVPSLLFVRCDLAWLKTFKSSHLGELMVYNDKPGTPAAIDDEEMKMFIFVTSAGGQVECVSSACDLTRGDRVRVTDGIYKGAEGVIKRIKKDRKLLVAVNGVAIVAISQIPQEYLEKIN